MCNGRTLEEWQASCVRYLLASGVAELKVLVIDKTAGAPPPSLLQTPFRRWLYTLYRRTWFIQAPRRPVDMQSVFSDVATITPEVTVKGRFSQYFDDESLKTIRSHDLDFLLRFGFNIVRGEILSIARYGVWSFHHADVEKYRGSPAGFWEIYHGDPVTGAILQRLTERLDGGIVLRQGHLKTVDYSYVRNIHSVYHESAAWPALVCQDIRNGDTTALAGSPSGSTAPIYYPPSNLQLLRFAGKIGWNRVRRRREAQVRQLAIGVVDGEVASFLEPDFNPSLQEVDVPTGVIVSNLNSVTVLGDGAIVFTGRDHLDDTPYTIFADLSFTEGRWSFVEKTKIRQNTSAFAAEFVFDHAGSIYGIFKSSAGSGIELYSLDPAKDQWQKEIVLIKDIDVSHPTVFQYEDRWWLFGIDNRFGGGHRLVVYYADDLKGAWQSHSANPVKIDIRSSQPAGPHFFHDGDLYRPVLNGAVVPRPHAVVNRVLSLSPAEFAEETVREIRPAAIAGPRLVPLVQ